MDLIRYTRGAKLFVITSIATSTISGPCLPAGMQALPLVDISFLSDYRGEKVRVLYQLQGGILLVTGLIRRLFLH